MFVYGTLKRGLENAHYMNGQRFVGEAKTEPRYRMADCGGYPGMYEVNEGGLQIKGEVWEVDEAGKAGLDELEDVDRGLYTVDPVYLEEPFQDQDVTAYFYRWSLTGLLDAGDDWK